MYEKKNVQLIYTEISDTNTLSLLNMCMKVETHRRYNFNSLDIH